ncbi:hypothetical protein [Actinomadura sp. 21ATH]|uniref:hypothetical protein n=1 Tax=Actinomadura sp. 21ATH TaxID=1735444 RepID=UPI0035BF2A28
MVTVAVGVCAWTLALRPLGDNSFLWHLRTGHWILDHGVPRADLYSFTAAGRPWTAQSWLAEVLYALLDDLVGPGGIRMLQALVGALLAMLAHRLALRLVRHNGRAAFLAVAALTASLPFWSSRPLFLGLLAMAALVWIVELPDSWAGSRPVLLVPLLMWAWANVHGGFVLGFGYLGLHLAGRWLEGHRPVRGRERRLLVAASAGAALCLANPYGIGLLTFPFRLALRGGALADVEEWRSPDFGSLAGILFAVWLAVLVAALAVARRRVRPGELVVAVPFLLLAFWAQRNIAVAVLVSLPLAARALAVPVSRDRGRLPNALLLAVLLVLPVQVAVKELRGPHYDLGRYPVASMRALEEHGLAGRRLLTSDRWAGYVIHAHWPRQRVFIDDRYDMYPMEVVRDHRRMMNAEAGWDAALRRWRIEVALLPRAAPLARRLGTTTDWRVIDENSQAFIFVRR